MNAIKNVFVHSSLVLFLILLTNFNVLDKQGSVYYYYKGEKIYLHQDHTKISISVIGEQALGDLQGLLRDGERLQYTMRHHIWASLDSVGSGEYNKGEYHYTEVKFDTALSPAGIAEAIKRFSDVESVLMVSPALISADGDSVGFQTTSM